LPSSVVVMDLNWNTSVIEQLNGHYRDLLRPRLDGMTDAEYFWEPVPDCWSIRPRGQSDAPIAAGSGDFVMEFALPEPDPAPVTTIAWRLAHIIVGVLGMRVTSHFGGPDVTYPTFCYAGTAAAALDQLDSAYAAWLAGVRGLSEADMAKPIGPAEGPFSAYPLATLVLHINREVIHHGAEIALLRDLYRKQA
jgi:hypothetical protein